MEKNWSPIIYKFYDMILVCPYFVFYEHEVKYIQERQEETNNEMQRILWKMIKLVKKTLWKCSNYKL